MRRIARMSQVFLLTAAAVTLSTTAAWAAPVNDDIGSATVISTLPFTDHVNTSDATLAPGDPSTSCFSPVATVWYTVTPAESLRMQIDTIGSDYTTSLAVFTGTPGQLVEVTCDRRFGLQSVVRFDAAAGTTYVVMAGTATRFGGGPVGPGGNLVLNASVAPPAPTVDVTVNRGTVTHTGLVTMSGTLTCSVEGSAFVSLTLVQRFGRLVARGGVGNVPMVCGTPWSVQLESVTGVAFGPGRTDATVDVFMCDPFECVSKQVVGSVHLRRG
jgi:hypothetical protein